jgi:hypothetical protein
LAAGLTLSSPLSDKRAQMERLAAEVRPELTRNRYILPGSGQEFGIGGGMPQYYWVADQDLIDRVAVSAGLTPAEAARVVADVLGWYREPVEDYVRRRHAFYQVYGKRNAEIFRLIAAELAGRVVAAPPLSERQLRRIVYS